jgi:hypothetical protein
MSLHFNVVLSSPLKVLSDSDLNIAEQENIVPYTSKNFFKHYKEKTGELETLRTSPKKDPVKERKILGLISPHKLRLEEERTELEAECQKIYEKAKMSSDPFVLGSEELRSSEGVPEMKNFGVLCTTTPACPKAVISSGVDIHTGSILCDSSWSVFKNDWAMMGVIHAGRTCYVSKIHDRMLHEDLWDDENRRPKVLGREIAMLHAAGYRQVASTDLASRYGHTFVALDRELCSKISYADMVKKLKAISFKAQILAYLNEEHS